jgi:hypothetical protein
VFSPGQAIVSGAAGAVLSLALLLGYARWSKDPPLARWDVVVVAIVVGLSIVVWRLAGNVDVLNEDPIPLVSPNDVLCPVLTYVFLGLYQGLRGSSAHPRWAWMRAALTLLSFVVNVVTV